MRRPSRVIPYVLACSIAASTLPVFAQAPPASDMPVQAAQPTPGELQRLVAPIALYPDALVAQILAAATYPDQVMAADRWLQQQAGLADDQLASQVETEDWDPSVKALTTFPAVLINMDRNLTWTSSLGDAYVNQEQDVMKAIQVLRQRAQQAGNLQSTSHQSVSAKRKTITIDPASTDVVYLPQYNPWLVYGAPIVGWPNWYWYPGLYWDGPGIGLGLSYGTGFLGGVGWGWSHWDLDWHHHRIDFDNHHWVSRSPAFANRGDFASHGFANRGHGVIGRAGASGTGLPHAAHGQGQARAPDVHGDAPHSGAFGGFAHAGTVRGWGGRGRGSFGGGFHGGAIRAGGQR
jgi:uncharacterized protein DUF3300